MVFAGSVALLTTACGSAEVPKITVEETEGPVVVSRVSLEEAKAQAQAMEWEMARLVPAGGGGVGGSDAEGDVVLVQ
ncbi:hypothetical protein [Microbacterium sp. 179-I 3D4 NHS]|uniref:hypothetical protein n=1 Tax=Microbacterium sp. 179-I 3D4 NHS TaxID=3142381 RepID=UPI0039A1190A